MADPIPWIFFCTEKDYPRFLEVLPGHLPSSYENFVAAVDQRIADETGQVTVAKSYVGFDEFMAFCELHGRTPDYDALLMCAFRIWGRYGQ
jgi:hypothetical protein